ncbi:MAG: S49 family peptidase [Myxococcota bacterium]
MGLLLYLWLAPPPGPDVPDGSVALVELDGAYVEGAEPPLLARLLGSRARSFVSQLSTIRKAERDERLAAIVFRIRDLEIGWGKAHELREAIAEASGRGRRTVAFLELESFAANLEYYVASGAQEVYVAPAARAPLLGQAAQYLFHGGRREMHGVEIEVERLGRFKSAAETFAGREMSPAMREMADALLDSVDERFVEDIAKGRSLPPDAVRAAIAASPSGGDAMMKFGLVDGVKHRDELLEELGGEVVEADDYAAVPPSDVGFDPTARFALVYGSGGVVVGRGDLTPQGEPVLASDTVADAIDQAVDDEEIDAIIFRVDSPGGSALASDIVYRATERARAAGKPVIASFSDVAASGGYYVAAGADAIFAAPSTITGSIGVFVLRPVLAGAFDKLDVGYASLVRGPNADLQLSTRALTPAGRERLRGEVEEIYTLFVERVADGRALSADAVDAVGQGRVWTGAQAKEHGLVDRLGGLRAAVLEGKQRAGIDADADVALVVYPPPRSLYEQLDDLLKGLRATRLDALPPVPDAVRRAGPWLRAAVEGRPTALIPFSIEIR